MPDAFQQEALTEKSSSLPSRTWFVPRPWLDPYRHYQRSILKSSQMPLLKRINTASGVPLCQEKMRDRENVR
jgi:hypothetical protein